jgi:tetratricopeptide (TPR) repeat protein
MRALLIIAALLLPSVSAHADRAADLEARRRFERGTKAYDLGDFKKAVEEYKEAYNARSDPAFLYNIAQALRLANDLEPALFFYRSYLRNVPAARNRAEVEERILKLEQQLAEQRRPAMAPPPEIVPPKVEPPPPLVVVSPPVRALPPARTPVYKRWWVWTIVGGVAAGAALGVGLGLGLSGDAPSSHFGERGAF